MKSRLLHPARDTDRAPHLPRHHPALVADLGLDALFAAMAAGDPLVHEVARAELLTGPGNDVALIGFRQEILADCVAHPEVVRELYRIALDATDKRRRPYLGIFGRYPSGVLHAGVELLQMLVTRLRELRAVAEGPARAFRSRGLTAFVARAGRELDDAYLARLEAHLHTLQFRRGVLVSAALGPGNAGTAYQLHAPPDTAPSWLDRLRREVPPSVTIRIHERDEAGARALAELTDRGINEVANAAAQASDHLLGFFEMLKRELAFYVGCLTLRERLAGIDAPTCMPVPHPPGTRRLRAGGLYDVGLALAAQAPPVGNALDADGRGVLVITGANQGGKSSFLRAIGLAVLMMQCGMFVGAESLEAEVCPALFSHFRREEDATMTEGKLDEELRRLSELADALPADGLVLFNESFAATNEREGSEIARQVVGALLERRVRVAFVTHLYDFARTYAAQRAADACFLRAERLDDGTRTFRLRPGAPRATSHAADVYHATFGEDASTGGAEAR